MKKTTKQIIVVSVMGVTTGALGFRLGQSWMNYKWLPQVEKSIQISEMSATLSEQMAEMVSNNRKKVETGEMDIDDFMSDLCDRLEYIGLAMQTSADGMGQDV